MFELYYSTGGHGGPYESIFEAKTIALRMLRGNGNEKWIDIKVKSNSMLVARITRKDLESFYTMGEAKKSEKFQAIFTVTATVLLEDVSDAALNNSKVLHPDVLEKLQMQLKTNRADVSVNLDDAFEYGTEGGKND